MERRRLRAVVAAAQGRGDSEDYIRGVQARADGGVILTLCVLARDGVGRGRGRHRAEVMSGGLNLALYDTTITELE